MMLWLVLLACLVPCTANQLPMGQAKQFMRLGSAQVSCSVAGPQGAAGSPGVTGAPGTIGRMGFPGKDGADGKDGPKGEKGDKGARGKPGIKGKSGVKGIRGAIGKAGPRGLKGFPGHPGTPGVDGGKGGPGENGEPGGPGICKCGMNLARCAFSVAITRSYPRERMPIKFDKILLNEGGNYNSSSGKFMCSIPGIYYFSYDITLSNKHLAIGLVHNGQYHIRTFDANTGNHDVASASTMIYLKRQDEVWLQIFYSEQNGLFYDPHWADSLFTGFLLYVDQDYLNEVEAQQFL